MTISSVTIKPDLTVFVNRGSPAENYGDSSLITYHLDARRTYIKFDLSAVSAVGLLSARLYYLCAFYEGSGVDHYRCTSNWGQYTLTWNNQPTFNATSMGATPNWDYKTKWYSCLLDLDEFALMKATNYGMCGKGTIADISTGFGASYLVAVYRPYLVLTYGAAADAAGNVIFFT